MKNGKDANTIKDLMERRKRLAQERRELKEQYDLVNRTISRRTEESGKYILGQMIKLLRDAEEFGLEVAVGVSADKLKEASERNGQGIVHVQLQPGYLWVGANDEEDEDEDEDEEDEQ